MRVPDQIYVAHITGEPQFFATRADLIEHCVSEGISPEWALEITPDEGRAREIHCDIDDALRAALGREHWEYPGDAA